MTIAEKLEKEIEVLVNLLPSLRDDSNEYRVVLNKIDGLINIFNKTRI